MEQNPYESPKHPSEIKSKKISAIKLGTAIGLAILTIPAVLIAFFTTCVATLSIEPSSGTAPLVVGTLAGIATLAAMIYFIARGLKRS